MIYIFCEKKDKFYVESNDSLFILKMLILN